MSNKIRLRIVTPSRVMYDEMVNMIILRGQEGDLGILPGHMPLTTGLDIGILAIEKDGETIKAAIHGGFIEVKPDEVILLTDTAEWPKEIDKDRAELSRERAEKRLRDSSGATDVDRASIALKKAMARINISNHNRKQ